MSNSPHECNFPADEQLYDTLPYSPHDLLPIAEPMLEAPEAQDYFYENVSKHLIPDMIRIMSNGIPIDFDEVKKLSNVVENVLEKVQSVLDNNPTITKFQALKYTQQQKEYVENRESMKRTAEYYLKPFKHKDMVHRSYYVNAYLDEYTPTGAELPTGMPKWTIKDVKQYAEMIDPNAAKVLSESTVDPKIAEAAMSNLAIDKMEIYNRSFQEQIENVDDMKLPQFNAGSSLQKQKLFEWLGIECEEFSKDTGLASWNRDEVERINRETEDDDVKEFTQAFIDHSFSAIIRNNFIKAFYEYSIDGILYGNLKLFGAKSFRLTSNNPNLLNMPSTKSIYAKPLKKCLVAPEGWVILTADYSALEDRVIASISKDENKCNIFLEGLDGHCLNAYGYFRARIEDEMPLTGNTTTDVREFFRLTESNKALKDIRQEGKPATFGLSYGAFPPKVAKGLKCTLEVATEIFNSYHNELYVGITKYREEYVLPTVQEHGKVHLGLGCWLYSDNPDGDIRTLMNATIQFWSILTLLAINKMHHLIDEAGLEKDVYCISTIYDSIYYLVREDATAIQWVNNNLIETMSKDFMVDQIVANEAESEIGRNWADLKALPNHASVDEITELLKEL